jgi:hypothetical protein
MIFKMEASAPLGAPAQKLPLTIRVRVTQPDGQRHSI